MANAKTTVKFEISKLLNRFLESKDVDQIGRTLVEMSKDYISKGISPVRGDRRFEGYKNPDKYPGDRKPRRPVNLHLSGDMLAALTFRQKKQDVIEYGIIGASQDITTRARVHNDGERGDIAQRAFIPDKPGQEFAVAIMRALKKIYEERLRDVIKRSNK